MQKPGPSRQAFPKTLLFFSLSEVTQVDGTTPEKRLKHFQSFVVPNTSATFPIPFALDIDSPGDCPGALELGVESLDSAPPTFRFTSWEAPLTGRKTIRLDKFETIPVWGPFF